MSDGEKCEEEKLIAFTAKVEQDAISSVSKGNYYFGDELSSYFSFALRITDQSSDLEVKNDNILEDLITVKKCNIKLLKRLNESEENMLQLQESKAKLQDVREENESLLAHLKEVEFNMKNVLDLNEKLQDNLEYLVGAHDF